MLFKNVFLCPCSNFNMAVFPISSPSPEVDILYVSSSVNQRAEI